MRPLLHTLHRIALALAVTLATGPAWAGAVEDTARAEESLRSGDLITAMGLLRKAADAGHAPAQARLGDLLDAAEYDAEAVAMYRKAAEQQHPAGELGLARMLAVGEGVARDPAQALALLQRAAARDHPPALEALARATRAGDLGLARDAQEAQRLEARAKSLREAQSRKAAS